MTAVDPEIEKSGGIRCAARPNERCITCDPRMAEACERAPSYA